MARVMVITRPNGAKPEKFFTILLKSQVTPSFVNRFWATTALPLAGFTRLMLEADKAAPARAVSKNRMQNKFQIKIKTEEQLS